MQITGKAFWTKLDKPVPNYNKMKKIMAKDGQPDNWGEEWSVEVGNLTPATKLALKKEGLLSLVKNKMDDKEDFVTFRLAVEKRDGSLNNVPKVVGPDEKPWDWETLGKIGNGSDVAVKFNVWKNPSTNKSSAFLVAVKVLEHIPYEAEGSVDYEDPDSWGTTNLDDDIPF